MGRECRETSKKENKDEGISKVEEEVEDKGKVKGKHGTKWIYSWLIAITQSKAESQAVVGVKKEIETIKGSVSKAENLIDNMKIVVEKIQANINLVAERLSDVENRIHILSVSWTDLIEDTY